jgi:Domain of unknown function (DUF4185)
MTRIITIRSALTSGAIRSECSGLLFAPVLAFVFATAACGRSSPTPPANPAYTAQAWPEADALFHQDPRWLGADGAFSVDLGAGRVLWLFGDTFVATSAANVRSESTMVRNTVAIQTGTDPSRASIAFRWGTTAGTPAAFFSGTGADWFWPAHGALVDGRLVVFLSRVAPSSGGLGFQADGWAAVRIDDPTDDPSSWRPSPLATPPSTFGVTFGEAAVVQSGYLHVFGAEDESHAVHLVRWPTSAVAQGDLSAPEWWTPSGWVTQAALTGLPSPLFADGATELSVQPDARVAGWIEVQTVGFGAATLDIRSAPAFVGPWGPLGVVYTPPESQRPGVLVYAGKGHPELAGADVVATYAANSTSFASLVSDTSLYYPRFVRVSSR